MKKNKILVIGETCNDYFMYGEITGKSPEGKGPVFLVTRTEYNKGMAANTAANLWAIGAEVDTFFDNGNITKIRYVDKETNELYLRADQRDYVDRADINKLPDLEQYDAIIISDYSKGFLKLEDIEAIASKHSFVVLDTKKALGTWCKDLKFIKLNRRECEWNKGFIEKYEWAKDKLIITLDEDGAKYRDEVFPTEHVDNPDVSGAGDTFVAAFTLKYLETNSIQESITFANKISSIVVAKPGVATP